MSEENNNEIAKLFHELGSHFPQLEWEGEIKPFLQNVHKQLHLMQHIAKMEWAKTHEEHHRLLLEYHKVDPNNRQISELAATFPELSEEWRQRFQKASIRKFREPEMIKIYVMTLAGKPITITVDRFLSIACVKKDLEALEGFPADQQRFVFAGRQLEDHLSLSDYRIEDKSTIYLTLHSRGNGSIMPPLTWKAPTLDDRINRLKQSAEDLSQSDAQEVHSIIENAQSKLEKIFDDVSAKLRLKHYIVQMEQAKSREELEMLLDNYHYVSEKGEVSHLAATFPQLPGEWRHRFHAASVISPNRFPKPENITVYVKSVSGHFITIEKINRFLPVFCLKKEILSKAGIPPDQQRLYYENKQLEDSCLLSDYNIPDKSVITYVLRLRGCVCGCTQEVLVNCAAMEKEFSVEAGCRDSVKKLKERIAAELGILPTYQSLTFEGKKLEDDDGKTLGEYGIRGNGHRVELHVDGPHLNNSKTRMI